MMSLYQLELLSFFGSGIAILFVLAGLFMDHRSERADGIDADRKAGRSRILLVAGMVMYLMAAAGFSGYSILHAQAVVRGADYDDMDVLDRSETVNSVLRNVSRGYIDQSDELPEDPSGCLVILFKYGCVDCFDVHEQLMDALDGHLDGNVYFVSSRSERGKAIVSDCDVIGVPYGIYFHLGDDGYDGQVLYDAFEKDDPSAKFIEANLSGLIDSKNQKK